MGRYVLLQVGIKTPHSNRTIPGTGLVAVGREFWAKCSNGNLLNGISAKSHLDGPWEYP